MLLPSKSKTVYSDELGSIDYGNCNSGYIIANYIGSVDKRCKVTVAKKEATKMTFDIVMKDAVLPLSLGSGIYTVQMFQQIKDTLYKQVLSVDFTVQLKGREIPFMYPNTYCWFTEMSKVVRIARSIANPLVTEAETVGGFYRWVMDNLEYDYQLAANVGNEKWWLPNPDSVVEQKKSICFGYASLLAALCRVVGIPCSIDVGYVNGVLHAYNRVLVKNGGQVTNYIYLLDNKWFRLDPTLHDTGMSDKEVAMFTANDLNYSFQYRG